MTPAMTRDASEILATSGRFIDAATFGAFLKNHRACRNLSLDDVAAETKIPERHLAALERGDVRSWPAGFYRRAMVRAYAAAIGLDPEVTVCEFADAFNEVPDRSSLIRSRSRPHCAACLAFDPARLFVWVSGVRRDRDPDVGHHFFGCGRRERNESNRVGIDSR